MKIKLSLAALIVLTGCYSPTESALDACADMCGGFHKIHDFHFVRGEGDYNQISSLRCECFP